KMRYVAAYLLAALGGNASPSADDIKKILGSVGIEVEDEKLVRVISELKGKNLEALIAEGNSKLASMPSGGAAPAAAAGGGATADGDAKEEKEEAKKESSDEESDDDMGFGLFD
ncbi:60S acidic ribosomal protein P2, partial [Salmonella sp. s54395]